jgi:hypothetical protein
MPQAVNCLPSMLKALGSIPSTDAAPHMFRLTKAPASPLPTFVSLGRPLKTQEFATLSGFCTRTRQLGLNVYSAPSLPQCPHQ